nr:MAG TPA: hypothetical protein [Bacteriophage sp.]
MSIETNLPRSKKCICKKNRHKKATDEAVNYSSIGCLLNCFSTLKFYIGNLCCLTNNLFVAPLVI